MTAPVAASGHLVVEDLHKSYGKAGKAGKVRKTDQANVAAVAGVSFDVPEGDFFTLLGPSGCGKTTTLRCIAGLERTTGGRITIAGTTVSSTTPSLFVPPNRRNIGMVFQSYAIWPHLTVFENVAFPMRVDGSRTPAAEMKRRVEEALATVRMEGYGPRMATQLSGGQQQRLALARALVRRPRLLLLDEPLSNLDAKLREGLRQELRGLQKQLGVTTLYVTHDQAEALSMSDTIAVMSEGKVVQQGPPRDIYDRPVTRFVANFVGGTNFIDGTVGQPGEAGRRRLKTALGPLEVVVPEAIAARGAATIALRPENIRVHPESRTGLNILPAVVDHVSFLGEVLDCRLRVGAGVLATRQHPTTGLRDGDRIAVELPPEFCAVLLDAPPAPAPATPA